MKKRFIKNLLLVVVMVVLCFAIGVMASAEERTIVDSGECGAQGDNVIWTLYDDGELVISGEGAMMDYHGDWGVHSTDWYEYDIYTVTIENGVTHIGAGAFMGCTYLKNVFLSNGLKTIGNEAFRACCYIENITIPESVTHIGLGAFGYCISLKEISLPDSVIEVGVAAFYGCLSLKKVTLPKNLITLNTGLFYDCFSLDEIIIPTNVTYIDSMAFYDCVSLDKVIITNPRTIIEETAFDCYIDSNGILSRDEWIIKLRDLFMMWMFEPDREEEVLGELLKYTKEVDYVLPNINIYCHDEGITYSAEAYATENGIPFEYCHFYEDDWTYDYDNMIRYRECTIENCDAREEEPLETTGNGDVEIIEPVDPDTDFVVDVIADYVIIEEALSNGVAGDFEIVKAFDITMKNKDGVHVQPDGTVKVKLPLDWSKEGVYKVYRVNDDGTLTDMNAYRQGSHMVFDTDHFSIYVIVDESERVDVPTDTPEEETKGNFFSKLIDLIKMFFALVKSWLER